MPGSLGGFSLGGGEGGTSSYDYEEGDSEDDYIRRNAVQNPQGSIIGAWQAKQYYKKRKAAEEDRILLAQARARKEAYDKNQRMMFARGQDAKQRRESLLSDLSSAFDAPGRVREREEAYQSLLGQGQAEAKAGYDDRFRKEGLSLARRGILGGSVDAEAQARGVADYSQNLLGVENAANVERENMRRSDESRLTNLRRAILSGNPQAEQAIIAQLQGENNQAGRLSRMLALGDQFADLRDEQDTAGWRLGSRLGGAVAGGVGDYYSNMYDNDRS